MDDQMSQSSGKHFDRRRLLVGAGTLVALNLTVRPAAADLGAMQELMAAVLGERTAEDGRITLDLPSLAENGATVPLTVEVESPMTPDDYVKTVHIMSERNPLPEVATFHLSPRNGRALIATRIRLAESQSVHAVAEMSDGRVYAVARAIEVTVGGCGG